jgi:glycosyltransferase involved in cell wall biosynthesis
LLSHVRRFDIVHVHLANLQADVVVAVAAALGRPSYVKVACGGVGGEVHRLSRVAWLTHWFGLRHATRVQALSDEISRELASIGVEAERVVRLPNGVSVPAVSGDDDERTLARHRLGLPDDRTIFLYTGRFARYKGVLDLLEVWRARRRPGALLMLVGTEAIDAPIGKIETAEDVIVHDWADDVSDYWRAADVFVNPTHADGMSNALLEALAAGMATVATRSGAAGEMIEDGVNGLLVDARDHRQLAAALDRLAEDVDLRHELGANARRLALRYSIDSVVDRLEASYVQMLT